MWFIAIYLKPMNHQWGSLHSLIPLMTHCFRLFRHAPPWILLMGILGLYHLLETWVVLYSELFDIIKACAAPLSYCIYVMKCKHQGKVLQYKELVSENLSSPKSSNEHLLSDVPELPHFHMVGAFPQAGRELLLTEAQLYQATSHAEIALATTGLAEQTCVLIIDSGASQTCIGVKSDFTYLSEEQTEHPEVKGIAQGLRIAGEGTVEYMIKCIDGTEEILSIKALYVPDLGDKRLLSPQGFRTSKGNPCVFINPTHDDKDPGSTPELHIKPLMSNWIRAAPEKVVAATFHPLTNLPQVIASIASTSKLHREALISSIDLMERDNVNLSDSQKSLLMLHFRLGHVGFKHIQWMVKVGKIKVKNAKNVQICTPPKCAACLYGKMTKRPTAATHSPKPREDKEMALRSNDLLPGQRVSVDHYESRQSGRLYGTRRGLNASTFCGGAIFVDHASRYIGLQHQITLGAADTIRSKLLFEGAAEDDGIIIQNYHTDNGVFSSKELLQELVSKGQKIRLAGSGAAHQNGIAERATLTIVNMARTMLLHAALRHGGHIIQQDLWPQAMDHAVWLYNRLPRPDTGFSPLEMWSRVTTLNTSDILGNCHVWGCPVFVLDPKLRKDGVKIPKWAPRSQQGVNMGFSRLHSSLIALVLNPTTKSITPQFHVVFDDAFTTVPHNDKIDPSAWQSLISVPLLQDGGFHNNRIHSSSNPTDSPELGDEWLDDASRHLRDLERRRRVSLQRYTPSPSSPSLPTVPLDTFSSPFQFQREITTSAPVETSSYKKVSDQRETNAVHEEAGSVPFTGQVNNSPEPAPQSSSQNQYTASEKEMKHAPSMVSKTTNSEGLRRSTRSKVQRTPYTSDFNAASKWKSDMVANLAAILNRGNWTQQEAASFQLLLSEMDATEAAKHPTACPCSHQEDQ